MTSPTLYSILATLGAFQAGAAPVRDSLSRAADISLIVVAVAILAVTTILLLFLLHARRGVQQVVRTGRKIEKQLDPAMQRIRSAAENIDFVSAAIRADVEKVSGTVSGMTEKLQEASHQMEERVQEFNALLEVVQEEAETLFVDTASTVRGVRHGARTLRRGSAEEGGRLAPLQDFASGELPDAVQEPERTRRTDPISEPEVDREVAG